MLRRNTRRVAHRGDSSDTVDQNQGAGASGSDKEFQEKVRKKGIRLRSRVRIPRLRVRIFSVRCLVSKVRESYGRLLLANGYDREKQAPSNKKRCSGLSNSSSCDRSSYHPDAIADCIEFIKRSASTRETSVAG